MQNVLGMVHDYHDDGYAYQEDLGTVLKCVIYYIEMEHDIIRDNRSMFGSKGYPADRTFRKLAIKIIQANPQDAMYPDLNRIYLSGSTLSEEWDKALAAVTAI